MESKNKFWLYAQPYGNKILYRGIENGRSVIESVPYEPTLFVKSNKPSKWKALYSDQALEPMKFGNIREAKDFVERYKDVQGFEVHGFTKWQYQFINEHFAGDVEYDLSLVNVLTIDIEVVGKETDGFPDPQSAAVPVVMISYYSTIEKQTVVMGLRDFVPAADDNFIYKQYDSEQSLLLAFVHYVNTTKPEVLTGWNSSKFDIPYLVNRIVKLFDETVVKRLSPFNLIREKVMEIRGRDIQTFDIVGVIDLDYLELYQKFTYSASESYRLDFIAEKELGTGKVEMPGKTFYDNYTNHFDTFVRYNAVDTVLVARLEEKMKLIELAFSLMYLYHCNLQDIYRTVVPWEVFIYNHLTSKNIVVPPKRNQLSKEYAGGWVKATIPGMYGWCLTFDFASLYPSIIRQWNISPETFKPAEVDVLVENFLTNDDLAIAAAAAAREMNHTVAANGTMYDRTTKGFLAELMELTMVGRKVAKKEMLLLENEYQQTNNAALLPKIASLNMRQMALKISANSAYGAIGQPGFHYYDYRMAEAITLSGQLSDMHLANKLNDKINTIMGTVSVDYVIAADTDSIMLNVDPIVNKFCNGKPTDKIVKFLDKFSEDIIQPVVQASVDELFRNMNCFDPVMGAKREAIASKALFRAKKNYAMYVHNSEGVDYPVPKLKVQGIEIVRSSTPQVCRTWLKECLALMFEKGELELRARFAEIKEAFFSADPAAIAFPRGINDIDKYYDRDTIYKKKGAVPIHVRAALLHNEHTKNAPIQNGDKIKFIYLKKPNPIRENVIGFVAGDKFPDIGLHKYVDYDLQFEKTFVNPLESLTSCAGWELEKKSSLTDFFG